MSDDRRIENRRAEDPRIALLVSDVHELKRVMDDNTEVTLEVRDILTTFHTLGKFAKWISLIVAAGASAWAAIKGVRFG